MTSGYCSLLKAGAIALLAAGGLLVPAGASEPKLIDQFSAETVMTFDRESMKGRIFVDRKKVRTEMTLPGVPDPTVSIIDTERGVAWVIMPGNMYLERQIDEHEAAANAGWSDMSRLEYLGEETVAGITCRKYRVHGDTPDLFMFIAENGLPVLIKSDSAKIRIEYRNVKPGPQPAALFQLPPGATKFSLPAGFNIPGLR